MIRDKYVQQGSVTYEDFWQSLIITYCITVAIVIAICILQFNIDELASNLFFYRIECNNHFVLILAKVAETLTPTTITFTLTILLSNFFNYKQQQITEIIVMTVVLALLGMLFPTMKLNIGFWIVNVLIYAVIMIVIFLLSKGFINEKIDHIGQTHKSEKSDGKFS